MVAELSQDLGTLMQSGPYRETLRWHQDRGLKIVPMDRKIALALAAKAVIAAECPVADLVRVLETSAPAFNLFVEAKLARFSGDNSDEYPRGEAPPKEERPRTLEVAGYPESFLVVHLCEFTLAAHGAAALEAYAKRYRLPKAKQYAKDVLRIFGAASARSTGEA